MNLLLHDLFLIFPSGSLILDFKLPYLSCFINFSISEGLDLVIAAIERDGHNGRIKLAIDVAATDFYAGNTKSVIICGVLPIQIWDNVVLWSK